MASRARVAGHPIHPMLVVFPSALFVVAFLCDLARLITGVSTPYSVLAYYSIAGGIVGALLAALPGFIDYLSLERPNLKRLGRLHMLTNSGVVLLFVINIYLRRPSGIAGQSKALPMILSSVGIVLLGVSGWLGGEMVYVHGVGVEKTGEGGSRSRTP